MPGTGHRLRYILSSEDGVSGWYEIALFFEAEGSGAAHLRFSFDHWGNATGERTQWISLTSAPCRFGGRRWFFVCPSSGRRCTKLLLPNGALSFRSRQAFRLAYDSTRDKFFDRGHRQLAKLYRRLGIDYRGMDRHIPIRPKGMWRRRFTRIEAAILKIEGAMDAHFEAGMRVLEARAQCILAKPRLWRVGPVPKRFRKILRSGGESKLSGSFNRGTFGRYGWR